MLDEFDESSTPQVANLNLIPIVDMLTTIIFFLQMTVTFYSFSKHTLPPSSQTPASMSEVEKVAPFNLKLLGLKTSEGNYQMVLIWQGSSPSSKSFELQISDESTKLQLDQSVSKFKELMKEIKLIAGSNEKSVRISLEKELPLQVLVSVIDSVKETFPDVVLSSSQEAQNYSSSGGNGL